MARIGVLSPTGSGDVTDAAFRRGLAEAGYAEGRDVGLEWRHADGRIDRLPALAADLVRLGVEVIVTQGTPAVRAAKEATGEIPIVSAFSSDPIAAGLVASLARPGGNVTGLAAIAAVLIAKRLQLLKEALPGLARVGVLWQPGIPDREHEFTDAEAAASGLGLRVQSLEVRGPDDRAGAVADATGGRAEALFTLDAAVLDTQRAQIVDLAGRARLPVAAIRREFVEAGGLMSYGANIPDMCRRAAAFVDKILEGARPTDLPIEQPTEFDFVINLGTARTLGLTIPQPILSQVTEVLP